MNVTTVFAPKKVYGCSGYQGFNCDPKIQRAAATRARLDGAGVRRLHGVVDIKTDGRISVDGRGLLLGGGDAIGTNGNQSVRARLFCGPAPGVMHDSVLVPLEPNGDFRIDGTLAPVPPTPCTSPVLLIVSTGGNWFAAGILK